MRSDHHSHTRPQSILISQRRGIPRGQGSSILVFLNLARTLDSEDNRCCAIMRHEPVYSHRQRHS